MVKPELQDQCVEVDLDSKIRKQRCLLELRPSQLKFPTSNFTFEVCKVAGFTQGYLNRQIIVLLSSLGITNDFFIRKQEQAIKLASHSLEELTMML